jgi:polysaccharide pyruvyl transferase WcaK-like protein
MKNKRRYNLALLTAPLFSNNMGCNALTYGSLEVLSEVATTLQVEFEYYLAGNPLDSVAPSELKMHAINFIDQLPDFSFRGLLGSAYRRNLRGKIRQATTLKKIDVFFDNAAGDSFSDIYGKSRFVSVLNSFNYALKQGKPLILLPQTIGPFKSDSIKKQAREILSRSSAVCARDRFSADCAKQLLPGLDVFTTTDVAMFMQHTRDTSAKTHGLRVGINPSGLLWKGGYTGQNQFGLKSEHKEVIRSAIRQLLTVENVSIELIGHDIKGPNAGNTSDDYYVCKLIQKEFPECRVAPFFYSPVEAKSYISGLDMLIGSRMHCCIAAYSSGVPVFPLAYSRKFRGLFADLGYPFLSETTDSTCEQTLDDLMSFVGQHEAIKAQMPERLQKLEHCKRDLVNYLSAKLSRLLQI